MYKIFDLNFANKMKELCQKADIIVPNIPEACFLLNIPYLESYTKADIEALLNDLANLGIPQVVLTGVKFKDNELGVASFTKATGEINYYFREEVPYSFHGTGDIYASCFFGALMNDFNLQESMKIAVDFTVDAILKTVEDRNEHWYGVHFESVIPNLIQAIAKNK